MTRREGAIPPAEPPRFDPVPGAVVAEKYRVERTLGEGGMGIVVAATHLGLEQPVAIKFLLPEAMRNKVAVERFLREARVAAKVRSEYVARVHDVGTLEGGVPYIVMEYLVGCDLGQLIAREGALPIDDVCEIILQASEALAEVHSAGIVHRDLKPSNLFVTRRADGSPAVKLLDFGISKLTFGADDPTVDPALTATTTIMGSPSYMSPEQLKSTKEVDPRADVWSLGAVLYEALTGKPAFRGETVPQVCAMIASEEPVLPSAHREGIPLELEHAVLACLEKDAARRITLVDLANALAHFAPDRARTSLERIEAILGAPSRSRVDLRGPPSRSALPALPLATSDRGSRTVSAWGRRERREPTAQSDRRSSRRGGGFLTFLAVVVVAGVAGALYSGRLTVRRIQGDIAGATSAVASAASAVSAVASSIPSTLPDLPIPALPAIPSSLPIPAFDEPTDVDAGSADDDDEEDAAPAHDAAPRSPSSAGSAHAAPTKGHPPAKPKHVTKHHRHG
jgi:serine/threonine-protein kinase